MAPEDINMWPEIWQSDEVDRANRMNALRESLRNQVRRRERQLEANHANSSPQSRRCLLGSFAETLRKLAPDSACRILK